MATAKQMPSGNWKCIAYLGTDKNGKKIQKSVTGATKREAEDMCKVLEATKRKSDAVLDKNMTVLQAVEMYIQNKHMEYEKGRISPTTIRSYKTMRDNLIDDIKDVTITKVNSRRLQNWVDSLEDIGKTPKTIKNAYSLIHASLMDVLPRSTVLDWKVTLPTIQKKVVNVPSEADINKLLEYFKVNDYDMYVACILISFGTLRRSEICALTSEDIEGNIIHINKALVRDEEKEDGLVWSTKATKTELSTRDVIFPESVIAVLPKEGKLVNLSPSKVTDHFRKAVRTLGIEDCTFHDLRHYTASIMHALGIGNEYIMRRGGWSSDDTLNRHYRGTISEYEKMATDKLNNHLEDAFMNAKK